MNKVELLQKISALATECHALACELDIGDERTEMFEIQRATQPRSPRVRLPGRAANESIARILR